MRHRIEAVLAAAAVCAILAGSFAAAAEMGKPDKEGWISLFDGKTLKSWHVDSKNRPNHWTVTEDGLLCNAQNEGCNLLSDVKLMDHELHVEFKVPKNGNSGVYLQGRYEVQVGDTANRGLGKGVCGAIYGKIQPTVNAARPAGEWQTFDIKFHAAQLGPDGKVARKARITVVHNKKLIVDNAEIDGVTGGAVDGKEGTPAGLKLQGDHTSVWYRNIRYRPIKK